MSLGTFLKTAVVSVLLTMGLLAALGAFSARADFAVPQGQTANFAAGGEIQDLALHPAEPSRLLALSERSLRVREGAGTWRTAFSLSGLNDSAEKIMTDSRRPQKIFLLAGKEALEYDFETGKSRTLFRQGGTENRVHSLALHPHHPDWIYLATDRGLFVSKNGGLSWDTPFRWPENQPVQLVSFLGTAQPSLVLATSRELFFSKDEGQTFESGFSLSPFSEENEAFEFEEEPGGRSSLKFTSVVSSKNPSRIWVGTSEGIFESRDEGVNWSLLPPRGLRDSEIKDLAYAAGRLIAATPGEVAWFDSRQERWETLSLPSLMSSSPALAVSKDSDFLWVANGSEVLEWPFPAEQPGTLSFIPSPERVDLFQRQIALEPTVRETQLAAIRYASLGNGKIKRWHWGSRARAFIPRFTFGRDFSLGNNVDIDRGSTGDADRFIKGPDDLSRGWDMGFTWELGDILYSSAQTSIDSREKLLVELRESILSQVTRIYFERRRIQSELFLSCAAPGIESGGCLDLQFKIEELTAYLDALTNGFFSEKQMG